MEKLLHCQSSLLVRWIKVHPTMRISLGNNVAIVLLRFAMAEGTFRSYSKYPYLRSEGRSVRSLILSTWSRTNIKIHYKKGDELAIFGKE